MWRLDTVSDMPKLTIESLISDFRAQFPWEFVSPKNLSFSNPSYDTKWHSVVCDIKFNWKTLYYVSTAPKKFMTEAQLDAYIEKVSPSHQVGKIEDQVSAILW